MDNKHGGNLNNLAKQAACKAEQLLDFSSSINPLGPPEFLRSTVSRSLENIVHYPDPKAEGLIAAVAKNFGIKESLISAGNGSEQIIYAIPQAFRKKALITVPSYVDYETSCKLAGLDINYAYMDEADDFVLNCEKISDLIEQDMLVFIGHPNNPTGTASDKEQLVKLAAKHPDTIFVIDEAFADFCEESFSLLPNIPNNIIILRSLLTRLIISLHLVSSVLY